MHITILNNTILNKNQPCSQGQFCTVTVGAASFLPPPPPLLGCYALGGVGDYGVHWGFSRQFHPEFISSPLRNTAAVVPVAQQASYSKPHPCSSHPPLPLDPPSPCVPGPHPFHRVPVPTRAHPPLVCFCLLAKASLFRPLAALHHFPCFFLLKLFFYINEDVF